MTQAPSLLEYTLLPLYQRPSAARVQAKAAALNLRNPHSLNTRDNRAATALVWANGVRRTSGPLYRHRLWRAMMRTDANYIKRPNVGDLACYNALAWAGGFTKTDPRSHEKKRVVLSVGAKMTVPARK